MEGVQVSTNGQNVLLFECYPNNINYLLPHFSTQWAFCGAADPETSPFRQGVIVCNINDKAIYFKMYLHVCIHAGVTVDVANDYIPELLKQGYTIKDEQDYDAKEKHLLIVGSNQSIFIKDTFAVINYGTPEFTQDVQQLFTECDLPSVGESLLLHKDRDVIKKETTSSSRGQPIMINFSYALQNSTDNSTVPGLNLPKLTMANIIDIQHQKKIFTGASHGGDDDKSNYIPQKKLQKSATNISLWKRAT